MILYIMRILNASLKKYNNFLEDASGFDLKQSPNFMIQEWKSCPYKSITSCVVITGPSKFL